MAVIGGFRSDLSITRKTDGNFGNVSAGVLFSKSRINENSGIKSDHTVQKSEEKNISIYSQLNFNGFPGVKLNVSIDELTHILLLYSRSG